MPTENALTVYLQELEESWLRSSVRKSEHVSQLLAEDFFEFGSSGLPLSKAQIMASLQAESTAKFTATEFKVQLLAPQIALVTYRAYRHGEPPVFTLRSSVWQQQKDCGKWSFIKVPFRPRSHENNYSPPVLEQADAKHAAP